MQAVVKVADFLRLEGRVLTSWLNLMFGRHFDITLDCFVDIGKNLTLVGAAEVAKSTDMPTRPDLSNFIRPWRPF